MYLFRLEDGFTPSTTIDCYTSEKDVWTNALKHIKGEVPAFYSWSKNLQVSLAKYYHAPLAGEKVSLYLTDSIQLWSHRQIIEDILYVDAGGFISSVAAENYFRAKGVMEPFPETYMPIEDVKVLTSSANLPGVKTYRFGYEIFFLVMIGIMCDSDDTKKVLNVAKDIISTRLAAHDPDLLNLNIIQITDDDLKLALRLVNIFNNSKARRYSIDELVNMRVWGESLPAGKRRLLTLEKLLSEVSYQLTTSTNSCLG